MKTKMRCYPAVMVATVAVVEVAVAAVASGCESTAPVCERAGKNGSPLQACFRADGLFRKYRYTVVSTSS